MKTFVCSNCKGENFSIYGSNIVCNTPNCRRFIAQIPDRMFDELLLFKTIEVKA